MPSMISKSRWHTGPPTTPSHTIRPFISLVESTRNSSRCSSGQRSISISSMCIWAELDPSELPRLHPDPAVDPAACDFHPKNILAGRHVANGEMLVVDGVGMVARPVGLDERERRLLRLRLAEAEPQEPPRSVRSEEH